MKKLDPRRMVRAPVMFVVELGSAFTTLLALHAAFTGQGFDRIARDQTDQKKRQQRHPEKSRDDQAQAG